ncbi:MAG: hypothetical protein ACE5HS_15365 [bacterium]
MNRFAPFLKEVNEKLNLPQPTKSRILLEMAADLEDLFNYFRESGLDEAQALQKTEEMLRTNDETLAELVQIHDTGFRKFLNKLSEQAQTRWERVCLVLLFLFLFFFVGREIFSFRFFSNASHFIWPILGISLAMTVLATSKIYRLFIKKDHRIRKLHSGLSTFLFLCGSSLMIAVGGFLVELYQTAGKIMRDSEHAFHYIIEWLSKGSALIIVSAFITIFAAILWFIFLIRITKIEIAEMAYLSND